MFYWIFDYMQDIFSHIDVNKMFIKVFCITFFQKLVFIQSYHCSLGGGIRVFFCYSTFFLDINELHPSGSMHTQQSKILATGLHIGRPQLPLF